MILQTHILAFSLGFKAPCSASGMKSNAAKCLSLLYLCSWGRSGRFHTVHRLFLQSLWGTHRFLNHDDHHCRIRGFHKGPLRLPDKLKHTDTMELKTQHESKTVNMYLLFVLSCHCYITWNQRQKLTNQCCTYKSLLCWWWYWRVRKTTKPKWHQ